VNNQYDNSSIDSLEGAERVRQRPAAVLGSDGIAGARHGFIEIVGNAVDEATAGFGDKLDITYYKDGGVSVRDYGRGVPMGYNENKGVMNWYLVFNEMYAGGKYKDYQEELKQIKDWSKFNPKDYNYLFSIGLNGLGAASTQYTSEYFEVISYRNGVATKMEFKNGYPLLHLEDGVVLHATPDNIKKYTEETGRDLDIKLYEPESFQTDEPNGTFIKWKPDILVFSDVDITFEWVKDKCEAVAYSSGLSVNLFNEETGKTIYYEKGTITDFNLLVNKNKLIDAENPKVYETKSLTHGLTQKGEVYVCDAHLSFVRTESNGKVVCFHNSVKMSAGAQYNGITFALSDFFSDIGEEHGLKITETDYKGKVGVVVNSYSNIASYKGQTKEEVDNDFILKTIYNMLYNLIRMEYHKGNADIKQLVDDVINEAQMRIQLQQQAKALREVNKASRIRKTPEKFRPSTNFNEKRYDNSELWIVEGDSALGCVEDARDSTFQAIYAVRGKMTNALKASLETILKTTEIRDIFALAGTGMQIEGIEEESFDINKSRFSKYIIGTDADEDGYQIRVLIFCAFWKLAPEIIKRGMLYIAESPKFGITLKDGSRIYAVREEDKERLLKEYSGQIAHVERYKGLGEVDADVLAETTVDPRTRKLTQIQLDPADYELNTIIETIFGKDPYKQRKETLMRVLGSDVVQMFDDNAELFNLIENSEYSDEVNEVELV
jgi:DNA gyrase subunit B